VKSPGFTYWQNGNDWIGYLDEFPDYQTQGSSLEDLKAHLVDLHKELVSGVIPSVQTGVQRMEDIIKGHTAGLTESQFRQSLQ